MNGHVINIGWISREGELSRGNDYLSIHNVNLTEQIVVKTSASVCKPSLYSLDVVWFLRGRFFFNSWGGGQGVLGTSYHNRTVK